MRPPRPPRRSPPASSVHAIASHAPSRSAGSKRRARICAAAGRATCGNDVRGDDEHVRRRVGQRTDAPGRDSPAADDDHPAAGQVEQEREPGHLAIVLGRPPRRAGPVTRDVTRSARISARPRRAVAILVRCGRVQASALTVAPPRRPASGHRRGLLTCRPEHRPRTDAPPSASSATDIQHHRREARHASAQRTGPVGPRLSRAAEPERAQQARQRRAEGPPADHRHLPAHRVRRHRPEPTCAAGSAGTGSTPSASRASPAARPPPWSPRSSRTSSS